MRSLVLFCRQLHIVFDTPSFISFSPLILSLRFVLASLVSIALLPSFDFYILLRGLFLSVYCIVDRAGLDVIAGRTGRATVA